MWLEDCRLEKDYPKGVCRECELARTCTDSCQWKICECFWLFDRSKQDAKDKEIWRSYRPWELIHKFFKYTTEEENEIDAVFREQLGDKKKKK